VDVEKFKPHTPPTVKRMFPAEKDNPNKATRIARNTNGRMAKNQRQYFLMILLGF
jgi:hypothetical protein